MAISRAFKETPEVTVTICGWGFKNGEMWTTNALSTHLYNFTAQTNLDYMRWDLGLDNRTTYITSSGIKFRIYFSVQDRDVRGRSGLFISFNYFVRSTSAVNQQKLETLIHQVYSASKMGDICDQ